MFVGLFFVETEIYRKECGKTKKTVFFVSAYVEESPSPQNVFEPTIPLSNRPTWRTKIHKDTLSAGDLQTVISHFGYLSLVVWQRRKANCSFFESLNAVSSPHHQQFHNYDSHNPTIQLNYFFETLSYLKTNRESTSSWRLQVEVLYVKTKNKP